MLKKISLLLLISSVSLSYILYNSGYFNLSNNNFFNGNSYVITIEPSSTLARNLDINIDYLRGVKIFYKKDKDNFYLKITKENETLVDMIYGKNNTNIKFSSGFFEVPRYTYLGRYYWSSEKYLSITDSNQNSGDNLIIDGDIPQTSDFSLYEEIISGKWLNINSVNGNDLKFSYTTLDYNKKEKIYKISIKDISDSSFLNTLSYLSTILSGRPIDLKDGLMIKSLLKNSSLEVKLSDGTIFKISKVPTIIEPTPVDLINLNSFKDSTVINKNDFEKNIGKIVVTAKAIAKMEKLPLDINLLIRASKEVKVNQNISYLQISDDSVRVFDNNSCIIISVADSLSSKSC